MTPARSLHRFDHCHAKVQHVGDDLQIGLHLGIRSRGTANQDETPLSVFFLEHHVTGFMVWRTRFPGCRQSG